MGGGGGGGGGRGVDSADVEPSADSNRKYTLCLITYFSSSCDGSNPLGTTG